MTSTPTRPPAVIVDMDGTLADVKNIRHHVTGGNRDFTAFHAASVDTPPHHTVVAQTREFAATGHNILIVTARGAAWRHHTAMWLALHDIPSTAMFMRARGDQRPDVLVKTDILASIQQRWTVVHAIDDNPSVIALWNRHHIPTTVVPGWND